MADRISFYPGPSKVYEAVPDYVRDAYKEGILSINHRSEEFVALSQQTITLLKEKLQVPQNYTVFFTSSATECWEIIGQSLIDNTSYHFFNGAFGEKWFEYTKKLYPYCIGYRFDREAELKIKDMDLSADPGLICITQNETSNGTSVSNKRIGRIRQLYPDHLIAVDATSSLAGVSLDIDQADVWFASVQKCFGLPAGMAVMICSPAAIEKALAVNEHRHYNSLVHMIDKMKVFQTTHTPNVLAIYLLNRVLSDIKPVKVTSKKIKQRMKQYYELLSGFKQIQPLIQNKKVRSSTVLTIKGTSKIVSKIKKDAANEGIILGNGYGDLKADTFRIANFPAIKAKEIDRLYDFFEQYVK